MARKISSKSKAKIEKASEDPAICFVIMPFGGWLNIYYEEIYRRAIRASGLIAHRADDLFRPSTIVNDIWAYTRRARLVLADLTGKNPNVFYELGLAHALAKPAILIAESMDDIPFDLRALRIITYDKNAPKWGEVLRQKVQSAIEEVLKSPAEAVLPAFLDVKNDGKRMSVTSHELEFIKLKQEIDLLRREVRSSTDRRRSSPEALRPEDYVRKMIAIGSPGGDMLDWLTLRGVPHAEADHLIRSEMARRYRENHNTGEVKSES